MTIFGSLRTRRRPDLSFDRDPYLEGLARQMLRLRERTVRRTRPSF